MPERRFDFRLKRFDCFDIKLFVLKFGKPGFFFELRKDISHGTCLDWFCIAFYRPNYRIIIVRNAQAKLVKTMARFILFVISIMSMDGENINVR